MTTKQDLIDAQLEAAKIIRREQSRRSLRTVLILLAFAIGLLFLRTWMMQDHTGNMLEENRRRTANPPVAPN
jgi:hypothetical protein